MRPANTLPDDSSVWVRTGNNQTPGRVVSNAGTPRSYVESTSCGQVCRNTQQLTHRVITASGNSSGITDSLSTSATSHTADTPRDRIMTRTQTSTDIRSPNELRYD